MANGHGPRHELICEAAPIHDLPLAIRITSGREPHSDRGPGLEGDNKFGLVLEDRRPVMDSIAPLFMGNGLRPRIKVAPRPLREEPPFGVKTERDHPIPALDYRRKLQE